MHDKKLVEQQEEKDKHLPSQSKAAAGTKVQRGHNEPITQQDKRPSRASRINDFAINWVLSWLGLGLIGYAFSLVSKNIIDPSYKLLGVVIGDVGEMIGAIAASFPVFALLGGALIYLYGDAFLQMWDERHTKS